MKISFLIGPISIFSVRLCLACDNKFPFASEIYEKESTMLPSSLAQRILQRFPSKLAYCFAYGSGVKKQTGYDDKAQKDAMIDLILCVDNGYEFHAENLKRNPRDYSFMRFLGPKLIDEYQGYAANVYCNTLIPIDKHTTIKYGVIRTQDFSDDLNHWAHLYVAGRLHKPVETLVEPTSNELKMDIIRNRDSALHAALLMLPQEFTYFELFHAIANISYHMDFRMLIGEKKNKVKNIVEPQIDAFLKLYAPHLKKMHNFVQVPDLTAVTDKKIKQDKSPATNLKHLEALPTRCHMMFKEMNEPIDNLAHSSNCPTIVLGAVGNINWESSVSQTFKNIPTAGLFKAIRYGSRKFMKTFSK